MINYHSQSFDLSVKFHRKVEKIVLYVFRTFINAIDQIFIKDWLNKPQNGETEILENWTFAIEVGGL